MEFGHFNIEYIGEQVAGVDREATAWSAKRQDQNGVTQPRNLLAAAMYVKVGGLWIPMTV